jgi:hypothetical protein
MDFSRDFIAFACERGVLRISEFKTKAGRLPAVMRYREQYGIG